MNFKALVDLTLYSPVTLAQGVLYGTISDRVKAQIANTGYVLDPDERKLIVKIASGDKEARAAFLALKPVTAEAPQMSSGHAATESDDT